MIFFSKSTLSLIIFLKSEYQLRDIIQHISSVQNFQGNDEQEKTEETLTDQRRLRGQNDQMKCDILENIWNRKRH